MRKFHKKSSLKDKKKKKKERKYWRDIEYLNT